MKDQLITAMVLAVLSLAAFGCAPQKNILLGGEGKGFCQELTSGKMWQLERGGPFSSLQEAEQYAAQLQLGGYDDWRLPANEELLQLFRLSFWKKNQGCELKQSGEFWSVSRAGKASLGHWESYILCDPEFRYVNALKTSGYVRAIRP
ncbi:Lcl domain-containing protein [Desulfogranum mediterraneum]|uniref:Lcl domain-containing protein n=1 Tax=Desulfogranum mediterraneum TaxID=160661 RepID=UPI0003FB837C|nr:DUF1566 domain-containing protein [Desulfogranum mediterraneum]